MYSNNEIMIKLATEIAKIQAKCECEKFTSQIEIAKQIEKILNGYLNDFEDYE